MKRLFSKLAALVVALAVSVPLASATPPTAITPIAPLNPIAPVTALSADVLPTAADASNGNSVTLTGREIILVLNTDTGSHTVTFTSTPDSQGRSGDITSYAVAAGVYSLFGPFPLNGWLGSNGSMTFSSNSALVKFFVIRLPHIN